MAWQLPQAIARILLAAILSDTLNLQSVTTTNADRFLVTVLCILGECDDPDELARKMFRAKTEWIVGLGAGAGSALFGNGCYEHFFVPGSNGHANSD